MTKEIMKPGGKLPTQDIKTFNKVLRLVVKNWNLTKPVDIMLANRMVSTFMKLKYIEDCVEEQGSFSKGKDNNIRMNPMVYYARDLQNDLMRFYRLFQGKGTKTETGPTDFSSWLD